MCQALRRWLQLWPDSHLLSSDQLVLIKRLFSSSKCSQGSLTWYINGCFSLTSAVTVCMFPSSTSFLFVVAVCSEGGGQHAGHHHSLMCGRRHRIANGLHVAQELHSLCSCQAWGEKVSFHDHLNVYISAMWPPRIAEMKQVLRSATI